MTTTDDASPRPALPEQLARAAVQKAITDALTDAQKAHRDTVFEAMLAAKKATASKSFNVEVDGEVVATATITDPKPKFVVQTVQSEAYDEFLDYMQEHYPTEVETVVQVRPAFLKTFLEKDLDVQAGEVFDTNTGEPVPGVKHVPAGDPTSWSLRFKKGEESKEQVLRSALAPEALAMLGLTPELELPTAEAEVELEKAS